MSDPSMPNEEPAENPSDVPGNPAENWGSAYPVEAFDFVREGLDHTVHSLHGAMVDLDEQQDRHVDGRQLSLGLRDHAIRRFGLLAHPVLKNWNITRSDDFGRIVYAMIQQGTMSRTERDRIEDFFGVFDFDVAFCDEAVEDVLREFRDEERIRG